MKEKTFEELALELASARFWDNGDEFVKTAECRKCLTIQGYDDVPMSFFEQKYKMNQLPTDRIKLTENK